MLLKILLVLLAAISFSSCIGDAPVEPEIEVCDVHIKLDAENKIDLSLSYEHCISDINPSDQSKMRNVPLVLYLLENSGHHVSAKTEDYTLKVSWGTSLEKWGETHCK